MFLRTSFKFLIASFLITTTAKADDAELQSIVDSFISNTPIEWSLNQGQWKYVDIISCFTMGKTCFGNNPTSPYGYPSFDSTDTVGYFNLDASEAIVLFLRTPPKMRYFGFTQYLYSRGESPKPVFASLSDTLNNLKFKTIDKKSGLYSELAVLVWTADLNTLESVQEKLALQGIDPSTVNFIPIPITFPLNMGYSPDSDKFAMLMRTAMPDVEQNWVSYMQENPIQVFKINPNSANVVNPAPVIGYADEISGVKEDPSLEQALESLVADVKRNYLRNYSYTDYNVSFTQKLGWDCITGAAQCNGDNHDALYSVDSPAVVKVNNLKDVVFIAGVNQQKTGKALYLNHSVYDPKKVAGIVSVADPLMTSQSAYYHANVKLRDKEKLSMYSKMYVYAISYDCTGLSFCLQIPAPTEDNPVGLAPGSPFLIIGRKYVDPVTTVRPSPTEVTKHRSFMAALR
jgi:hypothetical protein